MIRFNRTARAAFEHGHAWIALAAPLWTLAMQLHGKWQTGCYVFSTLLTLIGISLGAPDNVRKESRHAGPAVEE